MTENKDDSRSNRTTEESLTALGRVAERAGPEGRTRLGNSIAAALPDQTDLNQFDDRLHDLAERGEGHALSLAISNGLVAAGKTRAAGELSGLVVDQVEGAQEAYDAAAQKRDEAEARLNEDIAAFGDALTPEQLEAYKSEYRALHADVYAAERAAADNLARTLEQGRPVLEAQALDGNKDAAKALYNGYNALSRSPAHAADSIRWATELATLPPEQNPLFRAIDSAMGGELADKLENELLTNAVANAQADILSKSRPGSDLEAAQAAAAELTALLAPLGKVAALKGVPEQIGRFLQAVEAGARRDWDTVANNLLTDWDKKGNFGKALAIAGVAQSAYGAADAFRDGRYPDAIRNSAAFTRNTLEVSAGLLNTFGKSSALATDVAKVAGRLAPGLGLVIDAIQFRNDVDGILKDPTNAGKYVQILGTSLSLLGDALGVIPVAGTAADAVLGLVGQGIHAIGGYISMAITGNREAEALLEERTQLVAKVTGMDARQSRELVAAGAADINRLRQLGFSQQQIQELAKDPAVDLTSMETAALLKTAAGFGLRGDDLLALLRAGQNNDDLEYVLVTALNSPEATRGAADRDLSQYQEQLLIALEADPSTRQLAEILRRGSGTPDFNAWGQAYDTLEGDGYTVSA